MSNYIAFVHFLFCKNIYSVCRFFSRKVSEMYFFSRSKYSCTPSFKTWSDTTNSRYFIWISFVYIMPVYFLWNISKIADSIVCFYTIYMVYIVYWLYSRTPQPSHSMCVLFSSAYFKHYISIAVCNSNLLSKRVTVNGMKSGKNSSFLIILKEFRKGFFGEGRICFSHDAPNKQSGKKPCSVISTSGLRYFTPIVGNVAEIKAMK